MTKSRSIVTIEVTAPSEVELRASEARDRYVSQFLSPHEVRSNTKAYLYPEVHAVLSRMVKALGKSGVSIGSYASEILLDHFAHHRSVMQSVFDNGKEPAVLMEMVLIIALLVSNVWLIRKVLNKPDAPTPEKPQDAETPPAPEPEEPADIVGTSTFDIREFADSVREAAKEAAVEAAKEAIPLIVKELGTPADAGLPEESEQAYPKLVPKEDFTKVFSNLSASELTGETPPPAEPNADGIDFEDMRKTMEVIKDKPHTPEDEKTARRVLTELEGTELIEYVKLDPVVRKRILMIECRLPEVEKAENPTATSSEEPAANPQTRKIVFHADIDTTDIDAIDFNILH